MTSLLISIHPGRNIKIFNGDKTAEIRKDAPKDWKDYLSGKTKQKPEPRTAYIYCTKGKPYVAYIDGKLYTQSDGTGRGPAGICFNGKVVAKFTLREVEQVLSEAQDTYCGDYDEVFFTKSLSEWELQEKTCVPVDEIGDYMSDGKAYVWHISDLQIFDKPKKLSEFKRSKLPNPKKIKFANWKANYYWFLGYYTHTHGQMTCDELIKAVDDFISVKRAPQSWCYVEVLS